jgi:hypothetical protein
MAYYDNYSHSHYGFSQMLAVGIAACLNPAAVSGLTWNIP